MFERFTERSRRVVVLAQEEARMLDHNYIGTEHILLGLIHEGDGVAARAIVSLGLTLQMARDQVTEIIGVGKQTPTGHIPFTPRAKKVLELSLRESLTQQKDYIGTEHILLGLIREADGVGAQVLARTAPLEAVREQALTLAAAEATEPGQDEPLAAEWLYRGPQGGRAGFRLSPRDLVGVRAEVVNEFRETLASLGETLAALERRLAGIERQLGISAPAPQEAAPGPEEAVPAPEEAGQASDEAPEAPDGQAPGESPE
jgi:ATP-dependent Clp protease ATP-binding subunit ClpC